MPEGDFLVTIIGYQLVPDHIQLKLHHFQDWNAVKVLRSAKFCAHHLAKWAATNIVFEGIPNITQSSPLLGLRVHLVCEIHPLNGMIYSFIW
jgi:hypothetical protein